MADWELLLAAAAQHYESIVGHMASQGKGQNKIQSMVSTECVSLLHHHKVEKS